MKMAKSGEKFKNKHQKYILTMRRLLWEYVEYLAASDNSLLRSRNKSFNLQSTSVGEGD